MGYSTPDTAIYLISLSYEARGDDAAQLSIVQEQFPLFWEHPGVAGVTLWGYIEGEMWRNEGHLLTAGGEERPAL
jgi:endo-1,4-beta-xylanase